MLDFLLQLDQHIFHFINHDIANPLFDYLMPLFRNPKFWIPLYVFVVVFCSYKFKKQAVLIIILIAVSAGIADKTSAGILKPLIKRQRPCQDPLVRQTDDLRVTCGSGYSFPSTHATDHFAMATFVIFIFYKRWSWILFWGILWASSISFAQVYVGVHYPIDVLCGAMYGVLTGWLVYFLFKWLSKNNFIWSGGFLGTST
jgi:undecaprenyl-diphosphatase